MNSINNTSNIINKIISNDNAKIHELDLEELENKFDELIHQKSSLYQKRKLEEDNYISSEQETRHKKFKRLWQCLFCLGDHFFESELYDIKDCGCSIFPKICHMCILKCNSHVNHYQNKRQYKIKCSQCRNEGKVCVKLSD